MTALTSFRISCLLAALALIPAAPALARTTAQASPVTTFPANRATRVNPDTHLVLTFPTAPALGKSGLIRVYDASNHRLVDTLDLSIPAGPNPAHRITGAPVLGIPLPASIPTSPTTTTPAVRITPANLHDYQLTTVGGLPDFHFYPIILHGNVATIYLHNNVLRYGHRYIVQIAPPVFSGLAVPTFSFTTKLSPPPASATRLVVAADGSGDFNTVQGALDFVPDTPAHRITIYIKNGTYEEIVFFQNKSNLTLLGQSRDGVKIGYSNNSAFNPPQPGPNRRCAFSVYNSTGIVLSNFSVSNYAYGQAEGLLIYGSKNIVTHVNIKGSGDALNLRGSVYLTDSTIIGDGDTILGVGPAFFNHCRIESIGPFMWIRNTDANHGNVFLDCTFIARNRPLPWSTTPPATRSTRSAQLSTQAVPHPTPARPAVSAVLARLPENHNTNYPYAEAVLIHCHLQGIPPIGWGPIQADPAHLHLWEFDSTNLDGQPIDTAQRNPASHQLTLPKDAKTIADYSNPAFVLEGWTPIVPR